MKLWLIKAVEDTGYCMNQNVVVRAETEKKARNIAAEDDRSYNWRLPSFATCEELLSDGQPGIIIVDNNEG
jgi:hypothetical protein